MVPSPIQDANATGKIMSLTYTKGSFILGRPHELIIELQTAKTTLVLIAYGHTAKRLLDFLVIGRQYVIDYEPWIDADSNGEAFSAQDRDDY